MNGSVGIGIAAPEKLLHLKTLTGNNAEIDIQSGSKPKWGIYHDETTEQLRFWNGGNRVTFSSGGNVGIGTASPVAKLEIQIGETEGNGLRITDPNSTLVYLGDAGSDADI